MAPRHDLRAVALAAGLVGWSFVSPRIPTRWRVLIQTGVGTLLVLATRPELGLKPPRLRKGVQLGLAVATAVAIAVAASTALPAVRLAVATRAVPGSAIGWLAFRIPLGTVWAEEAAFRAALSSAAAAHFDPATARLLQATTFGLFHIADARATGAPMAPTVLVTGVAGWLLGWLADRSGSLAAPILAHLAINEAGAVAVLAVQHHMASRH